MPWLLVTYLLLIAIAIILLAGLAFYVSRRYLSPHCLVVLRLRASGSRRNWIFDGGMSYWFIDQMPDAMLILDRQGQLIDLNPAMAQLLGQTAATAIGRPAVEACMRWPELALHVQTPPDTVIELSGPAGYEATYYRMRCISLLDHRAQITGRLIMVCDITAYQRIRAALLQARQELEQHVAERTAELAMLNATLEERVVARTRDLAALYDISTLSSQAYTLNKMLPLTLDVTLQATHSTAGLIGLLDEPHSPSSVQWQVAAQQEDEAFNLLEVQAWLKTSGLIDMLRTEREPKLVPHVTVEKATLTLLATPMRSENQTVGVLVVMRAANRAFYLDEIALLTALADQIGMAVANEQLRQVRQRATVLAERQRISRDLHDATTQSLYGLVTLVEAAQAQRAAGQAIEATLDRMGDTARQALKEMRLFVFQLQPPALEELGLIGALQQRLASVEGRAQVQVRLLADETIQLAPPVEAALYFIAQEALNNILRHAAASMITVYLGREKEHIVLEVRDDGSGFDVVQLPPGGMGLSNMRARAEAINAQFKIVSVPEHGTRIKVTI